MLGASERLSRVGAPWRTAFELAWESWTCGSLGIGAVLADEGDRIIACGRNRVLENRSNGSLAGSLLAHAEMDAFAALRLRTAESLRLYTTVEPCLMCSATAIAMRTSRIVFAAGDPVFEGLDEALAGHSYMTGRIPARAPLGDPVLAAFAGVLPLANRAWSKPGKPPRDEWLQSHAALWEAANVVVDILAGLQTTRAGVDETIDAVTPALVDAGAIDRVL